jgi:hypothetical protein
MKSRAEDELQFDQGTISLTEEAEASKQSALKPLSVG